MRDENPATVTRLLFLANLSHERLQGYLLELTQKAWIKAAENDGRKQWTLTEEGRRIVLELERIVRYMDDFGLGL